MLQENMNSHENVHSFRPPSRDPRISERCLVCENSPRRFVFVQMTVGLKECYRRIRNEDEIKQNVFLENEAINEEVFSPSTGTILAGRYEVIAKVGEGQSSILVKAEDSFHPKKRQVAIKILHASYSNLGPQEASCLLHLKKADTLKVANIAHVLNIFSVGEHFCIVFEYLSPMPLYKYFQVHPFSSKTEKINLIRRIAFQVTQCLAVLSSLNIIHADIKPENILFANGDKNDVKIIDFGNAIYWVHDEMSLYFGSFELQTVFYRAPEVMFGLPFGPQIDMWSLGCVLAELYLGEPLFLATSKDEILEKMKTMLGPFPMSPFQSGKYFSTLKKFVSRVSTVPGSVKNVVNILKKLGSTDYIFADFLARILTFDPSLRLSPVEAARHPFLAPECALGFLLPSDYLTQESSYNPVLLTPATYTYRPIIDEKIRKLHYSELDLLHVGTQATTLSKADNVVKVLPFNYQKESFPIGNQKGPGNEMRTEATESRGTVRDDSPERFHYVDTAGIDGSSTEMVDSNKFPAVEDLRDNAFNESCSVLCTTKNNRSIPFFTKKYQKHDDSESYSGFNTLTDIDSLAGFVKRDSKDNAFNESCTVLHTTKDRCSISSSVKGNQSDVNYDESYGVLNTFKAKCSSAGSEKGGRRDTFDELCRVQNATKHAPKLPVTQDQSKNAFQESCSVINIFKAPSRFSKVESRREKGKDKKRPRKFVLRRRKYGSRETESSSSVSTGDISEDSAGYRQPYVAPKMSHKSPISTKSSRLVTFSKEENSSGKETGRVTSSTRNTTNSNRSTKKPRSTKTSSLESFLEGWNDFSDDGEMLVSSTNNPGESRRKSKWNRERPVPKTSPNSAPLSEDENSPASEKSDLDLVSSSVKPAPTKNNKSVKRTMSAKSLAEDGGTFSGAESKLATSSVEHANKSNESSVDKTTGHTTPRNSQRKESVFDTPASVITSTSELLPGGLSEIKEAIRRSECEQDNSNTLREIHGILRASLTGSTQTLSCEKKTNEISREAKKAQKRGTKALPRERTEQEYESQGSPIVTSLPTDILTQDLVKQPRKRKLSYKTVDSPGKEHVMSFLSSLRDRQEAKIQRLSDKEQDDVSFDEVVFVENDRKRSSGGKDDGRSSRKRDDDIGKRKENRKQSEEYQNPSSSNADGNSQRLGIGESCLTRNFSIYSVQNIKVHRGAELFSRQSGSSCSESDLQFENGDETNKQRIAKKTDSRSGIASFIDDSSEEKKNQLTVFDDENYEDYEVLLL